MSAVVFKNALDVEFSGFNNKSSQTLSAVKLKDFLACLGRAEEGIMAYRSGSDGKESACNVGDLGSIPGLGRSPGGGYGNPLQYSGLENPHGQKSLLDYSPQGCRVGHD